MTPGKRKQGREHWPDNLHAKEAANGLWYYYRRPDLPRGHPEKEVALGYITQAEAFDAARQANAAFGAGRDAFAKIAGRGSGITLDQYIDIYEDTHLADRRYKGEPLSPHTLAEFRRIHARMRAHPDLKRIRLRHDTTPAEQVRDQGVIAKYLNEQTTAETHNKHRARLVDVYKYAVSDGLAPANIPARILPKTLGKKVRQRLAQPATRQDGGRAIELSIANYNAIFQAADLHIRIAMELAINILQRRMELHAWRYDWSQDDADGRHVYIVISKTKKHGIDSYIRIPEALPLAHSAFGCNTLGDLLRLSRRDGIAAQHVVHHKPARIKKSAEKEHPFQCSRREIGDGFTAARDRAGIYDHLTQAQRPTLHELIATGEYLRKAQGWSEDDIRQLRGHSKIDTTRIYLQGHEYKTVIIPETGRK